jgi:hypothetical protein
VIPTAELPDRVTLYAYAGTTGESVDAYVAPVEDVPGRLVNETTRLTTAEGIDALAAATLWVRPGYNLPITSKVVLGTEAWRVIGVKHEKDLHRPDHDLVYLEGPFAAEVATPQPPYVEEVILDGGEL